MYASPNHPIANSTPVTPTGAGDVELEPWNPSGEVPAAPAGPKIQRYISALNRFKWLIVLLTVLGGVAGYISTAFIDPQFAVNATIALDMNGMSGSGGPIQGASLMNGGSWQALLRTFAVADPVVSKLSLFLTPKKDADSVAFRDFQVSQALQPGEYTLKIEGKQFKLLGGTGGYPIDSGAVGDAVGVRRGFLWRPDAQALAGRKSITFTVQTVREASQALIRSLTPQQDGPYLKLTLVGQNAPRLASTLNLWTEQFVAEATALKKTKVTQLANILNGQRDYQKGVLEETENALQDFRVQTVTQPNERQVPIVGGLDMTTPGVMNDYFSKKLQSETLQRDVTNLQKILDGSLQRKVPLTVEAVLSIPSVTMDPAASRIKDALTEQTVQEVALRKLQEAFTEADQRVINEQALLEAARSRVPREVAAYIAQLRLKFAALDSNIAVSGKELKDIPKRTIEEQKRKRAVAEAEAIFSSLDMKAQEAQLAEASSIADVSIVDTAVAPLNPTRNTAPVLIFGAIFASLAFGILLAVLLDQTDKRFRHPEQATDDLGLYILGVVPVIGGKRSAGAANAALVVETFRTIRMNVRYATEPGRSLTVTITSPGPNDGKSLISSNLALSFAESGARTLLIDGDIRRGELSKTFGTKSRPGLVEYLDGTALIAEVLQPTRSHANLTIMPAGARRRRGPELLATPRLPQLIAQLSTEFDVIIVDSPPLGAGVDAFALGAATGNMALVLRAGITDRKLAKAKLATINQLPVRMIGTV
ncbi:MAG: polysaccharide biosynthesis tyrosine autokinase, partial [Gemmatimonadota bacterium]|nr:polysaccharide biosynthesis tyrosine autokinase [Gemmatimonadota bacterium]